MTSYQDCHRHLGHLTRETDVARKLLERHRKASAQAVKELRGETGMPIGECADMLRCLWRDMELERLQAENGKLQASNEVISEDHAALCEQNTKLWELARLLLYGATHDAEPAEGLVWSQKVDALVCELGIKEGE